jgi:PAS domain S-box-containing protein
MVENQASSEPAGREPIPSDFLRTQADILPLLVESLGEGVVVADSTGRLTFFNSSAEHLLGIGLTDAPVEEWSSLYGVYFPDTVTPFASHNLPLARALRGEESNQVEMYIRNPNLPEGRFLSVTGRPLRDAQGVLRGGVVVFRDITERRRTEQMLLQQRRLLQALLDNMPDLLFFKDAAGRYTQINRAMAQQAGLIDPAQAVGRTDRDFFHDDYARKSLADEREVMRTGQPISYPDEKLTWKDRRQRRVSTARLPLRDDDGRITGTFGIIRDLSDFQQTLELMRQSEARFRNLFDCSPDAIYVLDLVGMVLDANPAGCQLLRREREDIVGRTALDLAPPQRRQAVAERLQQMVRSEVDNLEGFLWTGEGQAVPVEIRASRIDYGGVAALLLHVRDITERRQAEEDLRQSRERFALAVEGSKDGIWDWDVRHNVVYFSPRWKSMLGHADHEVKDRFEEWSSRLHPDDADRALRTLNEYIRGERADYELEHRLRHKDGSYRWILTRGVALRDGNGVPYRMAGSHTDITARKQIEEEAQRARQAAEEANQAKSVFLANVSHEVRTPLTGILGLTDLTLETALSDVQRDYLHMVRSSTEILLTVINDLLDFSKIEAGKLDLDHQPFALRPALAELLKTMAVRAYEKGLDLVYQVDDHVPERLIGDWVRLRQVLVNLVGNAIKFTDHGDVLVTVRSRPAAGKVDQALILFEVTDTGIGVPPDKHKVIFDPFVQVDGSMSRKHGGTGLGLAISTRLVQLMQGRLWMESEVGLGSVFRFEVPVAIDGPGAAAPEPGLAEQPDLKGMPIVVLEHNARQRQLLAETLTAWGARPQVFETLAGARTSWARQAPDRPTVVVMDARLSRGEELAVAGSPALVLVYPPTDRPGLGLTEAEDSSEDSPHVIRPIVPLELLDAVRLALSLSGAEVSVPGPSRAPIQAVPSPCPRVRPLRLLVAEDNRINQALMLNLLRKQGHEVVLAANGLEALAALQQQPFDAILMDVQMPELDGLQTTLRIRERERATDRHIPIIALTAHAMTGDRERCLEAGMDAYLAKPIDVGQLGQTLADLTGPTPTLPAAVQPTDGDLVLDQTAALARLNGDRALLVHVADLFLTELPGWLAELRSACDSDDAKRIQRVAHSLKGALGHLGAAPAATAARRLEEAGRSADRASYAAALADLEAALTRLLPELRALDHSLATSENKLNPQSSFATSKEMTP